MGFSASGHGGGPPWPWSTTLRALTSDSAVVPAAQPKWPRFALRGCAPGTTACAQYDPRGFHPVAKAARRHCQATQGCRVTMPSSAAMPGRQSLRLVAARHHRWCPVHRPGFPVSGQGGKPPCPCTRSVDKRRRRAASHGVAPPLRPPAALLHKAAFHKVPGSRCAKAPLGAPHRCAPFGFMKQALCKVASAPASCVLSSGFWSGASRSTLASGLRPVWSPAPARPRGLAASRLWPARPARPPPEGAPSARARPRRAPPAPWPFIRPTKPPPGCSKPNAPTGIPFGQKKARYNRAFFHAISWKLLCG